MDTESIGLTVYRVPRSHWHCTLPTFAWDAVRPAGLRARVDAFLQGVRDGAAPHLMLTGQPGIGKTHLGIAVYRTVAAHFGTVLATWINVPAFCELVKRSYNDPDVDPWEDIDDADRLLVLDDLFGRDLSPHEVTQIVYRLIDTAYQHHTAVLVTMNQDVTELRSKLAGHEISRLLANVTVVPMVAAKDWRVG